MAIKITLCLTGDVDPEEYVFENPGLYTIGRDLECSLVIPKSKDRAVSRVHCKLLVTESNAFLRDAGSSNGTFINGAQLDRGDAQLDSTLQQPYDRIIKTGDIIRIGNSIFDAEISLGRGKPQSSHSTIILPAYAREDKEASSSDDSDIIILPKKLNSLERAE